MTRFKRRLLWGLAIAAMLTAVLALYTYTVGTRTLLKHAEAFSFRRLSVAQLGEQESFRFFYTTNRQTGDLQGPVEDRYESSRNAGLRFGSFDTSIEPSLGLGIIIDPSKWFINEEINLQAVRSLEQEAFVSGLREQVEASPYRSLLLVVHGFREAFPSALRKTAFLAHVLDIDTPVMVFDWPGNQGSSLRGYRRARRVARESGAELADTLRLIHREVKPDRIWLMANSMGGQVVADAFSILYQDTEFTNSRTRIEDVVLTAPDVDHDEFNSQFRDEIKALAGNVTVYVSSNDRALLVSRVINRGLRLGESTLDPENPGQVEETANLLELLEEGDEQLALVDVTPVNRTRNFHNFSLETPEFFDDLYLRFTGSGTTTRRVVYSLQTPNGSQYYVLTQGR